MSIKGYTTIVVLFILVISSITLYKRNQNLINEIELVTLNQKAFISENSSLKNENRAFKFTIEQLEYYNDSILKKMNEVRKELNVKDKDLGAMQYILSEASKTDTVEFRDTIFSIPTLHIDTMLGDKWYQINLELRYPNKIITTPKFISEKFVIINYKKETINPPKKCWLLRLFQKKHKVIRVEVVEKNPYIENKQHRFIEIIK